MYLIFSQTYSNVKFFPCKIDEASFLIDEIYILRISTIEFKEIKFMSDPFFFFS